VAKPLFQKVVIFGVGLIGGSFSLALRSKHAVGEVVGFGRSLQTLAQAQQLGIIDRSGSDLATELMPDIQIEKEIKRYSLFKNEDVYVYENI